MRGVPLERFGSNDLTMRKTNNKMKRTFAVAMTFIVLLLMQQQLPAQQTRTEKDLLGEKQIDAKAYYGVQTARALENFTISGVPTSFYPDYVKAFAMVKLAAARANTQVGSMKAEKLAAIEKACQA